MRENSKNTEKIKPLEYPKHQKMHLKYVNLHLMLPPKRNGRRLSFILLKRSKNDFNINVIFCMCILMTLSGFVDDRQFLILGYLLLCLFGWLKICADFNIFWSYLGGRST